MVIKVGIVGCGFVGNIHLKAYREVKGVEVIACCDVNEERAKKFAEENNIKHHYKAYKKMIENENLDVLSVCTPNYAHKEPTVMALNTGINVLCEKPMAMNAKEAFEMLQAYKKSKKILTIGHHHRFNSESQVLKRFINGGVIGEIYYGRSQSLYRNFIPWWGEFHLKKKSGGGTLIDTGVHLIDLILWLMGFPEVKSVSGATYAKFGNRKPAKDEPWGFCKWKEYDVEDFASGYVRFKNGATLVIESAWVSNIEENWTGTQQLIGDKGSATINPLKICSGMHNTLVDITPVQLPQVNPHNEEIKWFIDCVRGEREILVKPEESYTVQRIMDAIYKSSEMKKEIQL